MEEEDEKSGDSQRACSDGFFAHRTCMIGIIGWI